MSESVVAEFAPDCTVPEPPLAEDRRLLQGLQDGCEWAYEELVDQYQQTVFNLVHRLLSNPADASDVVQEVFLKIFRSVGKFRNQSSLRTWIYRIAVNEAHNQRRWFFRHCRQEVGLDEETGGGRTIEKTMADTGRSPFDCLLEREQQVLVEEALSRVKPNFRAALVLRDLADLSYEEIAETLEISLGTVKSRILRGREAMRKQLAGLFEPRTAAGWVPQPVECNEYELPIGTETL